MNPNNFMNNDKLEYGQIILGHIKQILKLSLCDLSDGNVCGKYQSSILTLSDALYSYYDEQMIKDYAAFDRDNNDKNFDNSYRHYRNLFRALLSLVKRNEYFKSAVYGEDSDEVVEEVSAEETE